MKLQYKPEFTTILTQSYCLWKLAAKQELLKKNKRDSIV